MTENFGEYHRREHEAGLDGAEPDDGLTTYEVEAYRTIEIVGPVMRVRAISLVDALCDAEDFLEHHVTALDQIELKALFPESYHFEQERIQVRAVE